MPAKFTIDEIVYAAMLDNINVSSACDRPGGGRDAAFINDDYWLQDTAVIENIEKRKGEWSIYLVFAHHLHPLRFIKRQIVHYSCPKKAALAAHYMRRQAAKDQRGTLSVALELVKLSFN